MEVASRTEVGHVRRRNEDSLFVARPAGVVAVADGLGGHPGGDLASQTAVGSIGRTVETAPPPLGDAAGGWLVETLLAAHQSVLAVAAHEPELTGMATTVVLGVLAADGLWLAHVGDSRAYLLSGGELRPLTRDHGVGGYITQALGLDRGVTPEVAHVDLASRDRLLLCTDGLTNMVVEPEIGRLLGDGDARRAVDGLVEAALDAGGIDNVTVVVVTV